MRSETAFRAAADIRLVRLEACLNDRRIARLLCGSANSGNARSMATISARRCLRAVSAPARAYSVNLAAVSRFFPPAAVRGIRRSSLDSRVWLRVGHLSRAGGPTAPGRLASADALRSSIRPPKLYLEAVVCESRANSILSQPGFGRSERRISVNRMASSRLAGDDRVRQ